MNSHQEAVRLRQQIIDLYAIANNPQADQHDDTPVRADLDAAESALDEHLVACRDELAHLPEWRQDYQILDEATERDNNKAQFALVDITEHAQLHRLAVGKAWIENAIPREMYPTVLTVAGNALVPVALREIRRVILRITALVNGVLTAVHLSLVLRCDAHGVLTATILA
ncbi:hypothetical protein [Nocardia acidivorans]|uniref:hypothetical protein n=1 Tax=Nocardia acidivorans TaxID=404580 RepID=UPI0008361DEB|nr:hypothetical protein [Nocardia acidivorans]